MHVARAVAALRPCLVVLENVRGLLTSPAGSPGDVEPCPWCLGDTAGQPALRALGAVLGSLADLGYDAKWLVLRASDVGAPHRRERTFLAYLDSFGFCGGGLLRSGVTLPSGGRHLLAVQCLALSSATTQSWPMNSR
ncbi:DNA cytosine methyltransferase [Streptomyces sp. NPDC059166]|uniref:DNA cytosine methyltransferase n=1 Tax=Streptomyces sp. NPDC059166 TaxID=3346752 RepID=UPI00367E2270